MVEVRVNSDAQTPPPKAEPLQEREPYVRPTIEKFPPLSNISFGSNINPVTATTLVP